MLKVEPLTIKERSGNVIIDSKLVGFLYDLMRDHLPPGVVDKLVQQSENSEDTISYSNGWLAKYAQDLANRLQDNK